MSELEKINSEVQSILDQLNKEQKEAVTHQHGPLLIIAGAGTGKTTVITRRIAWLILSGLAASDEILAVTFTDKAAGEMEERVDKLLPYGYLDLWISTFHSFCERILHDHAIEVGLPDNFKLLNQIDQAMLIRENLDRFDLDYYKPLGNPTRFIQSLVKHFSRCKDEIVSPEDYFKLVEKKELSQDSALSNGLMKEEILRLKEIARAYHTYQQLLLENNALDFGDLINYTLKLFRERPLILEKYRQKFKYILVDEFQDTNYAQYELIKLLSQPNNNLTVCFDDDQSIYKFRGASVSNVLQFNKDFPQSKKVCLIKNYRSYQNILDLAYNFIQLNNPNRLEWQLTNSSLKEKISNFSKRLIAQKEGKGEIKVFHLKTQEEEAEKVAEKIIELKNKDKEASWNDFTVLVRANNYADVFIQAFSKVGIPYQFLASVGLYKKPVILDILAYLKLLDNYHESAALYRILNSPVFALKQQDLSSLSYWANRKGWSLYETLEKSNSLQGISSDGLNKINRLLGLIQKHSQQAREENVGRVILSFLEDSGYLKLLSRAESQEMVDNIDWLNQFFKKVEEFERTSEDKSLKSFQEMIELARDAGDLGTMKPSLAEEGPETVKILTIHGAKGLEFKYVFVVSLVDRRFPSIERKEQIELPEELIKEIVPEGDIHLQEERRLFYVAMTRAKDGLFFTWADDYGGVRKKRPSRFLMELGLVEKKEGEEIKEKEEKKEKISLVEEFRRRKSYFTSPWLNNKDWLLKLPAKFSFTQLKAFETCPLQYKFQHILHIPVRGKWTFSFGKSMHATLQKFFQRIMEASRKKQVNLFNEKEEQTTPNSLEKIPVSLEELLKIYEESWIEDWYLDKEHQKKYQDKGRKILKEFYKKLEKEGLPKVRFLELGFNFKLGDYTIKGVMDRVDELSPGQLEIIDYKTGQSKAGKTLSLDDKEQLLIYQMAAEEIFREKPVKLTFYYLDDNNSVSFLGKKEEIEALKKKIIKTIEEIKKGEFSPSPSPFKCKHCDFKDICEFRAI